MKKTILSLYLMLISLLTFSQTPKNGDRIIYWYDNGLPYAAIVCGTPAGSDVPLFVLGGPGIGVHDGDNGGFVTHASSYIDATGMIERWSTIEETIGWSVDVRDYADNAALGAVAFSNNYEDLSGKPSIPLSVPIATITSFAGSSAPTGYLLCDGTAVSRTIYSALFNIIGTTYGSGNGSTTFNIPNLIQRFPLGKATSGTGSSLGSTGGSIDHTHTVDPSSTSSSSNGSHTHTVTTGSKAVGSLTLGTNAATENQTLTSTSDGAHTHTVDIAQFDSGVTNPPFISLNYIIKI